jgi:hypothetical protein
MSIVFGVGQLVGAIDREPPRLIVDTLLRALPERTHGPLAGMLHIGYGAAAGAAYTAIARPAVRGVLTGSLFGLAVWVSSYEGWVPAAGVIPPAHRDRRGRAVAMLLAHVVYGGTLGEVARRVGAAGEGWTDQPPPRG